MALIGNQIRQYSDRVVLDSLTASATADYTLQLNSTDFVPSSAESLTVSLNGIIQKPQDSYTVSGSTLTFDSALTASDSIDFIIAERGITLQTPSAGSVGTSQLANNAVTYAKSTGFGKVAQVINGTSTTAFVASSPTNHTKYYPSSNKISLNITPSSTSSKILVTYTSTIRNEKTSTGDLGGALVLKETIGATVTHYENKAGFAYANGFYQQSVPANYNHRIRLTEQRLLSPSTTSQITYEVGVQAYSANKIYLNDEGSRGEIIAMEILG